jgi:uncharacterized protein
VTNVSQNESVMRVVLDSWAIIRMLDGTEPTASKVDRQLDRGDVAMSWINLGEVYYVLRRREGEDAARRTIQDIEAKVNAILPDRSIVIKAATIKSEYPMSYADAFAAATAIQLSSTLWTGDPELLVEGAEWHAVNPATA